MVTKRAKAQKVKEAMGWKIKEEPCEIDSKWTTVQVWYFLPWLRRHDKLAEIMGSEIITSSSFCSTC